MKSLIAGLAIALLAGSATFAETFQYAIPFNENDAYTKVAAKFAEDIKAATNGEITLELAPNSALVPLPETLDAVADGVVPFAMTVASFTSGTIPAMGFLEMVGGVPEGTPSTADALSQVWGDVSASFEAHGARALWGAPAFAAGMICRDGFLKAPQDWVGKKIRTAGRWQSKQVEAMGAVPVPMAPSELYVALQNGAVDCALLVPTIVKSARLYEVAPYNTNIDLPANVTITIINADVWAKFTDAQKEAISKASAAAIVSAAGDLRAAADDALAVIAEKGKLYALTPEERAVFTERSKPLFDEVTAAVTDEPGKALIGKLASFQ